MESKPSERQPTTSETTTKTPTLPAGWAVTYADGHGKAVMTVRLDPADVNERGLTNLIVENAPPAAEDVLYVKCSACDRRYLSFVVPHDPRVCDTVKSDAGSYRGTILLDGRGRKPVGPPKVLPHDRRTRAYKNTRRELGLLP